MTYPFTVICFFHCKMIFICKSVQTFLHENFYTRPNYSNRAVLYINHVKTYLRKNYYKKSKANYGNVHLKFCKHYSYHVCSMTAGWSIDGHVQFFCAR